MIAPVDPALFGEPFPAQHPWSAPTSRWSGWEVGGTRVHLLRDGGGCTLCRRGIPRCKGVKMKIAGSFHRATCARCIKHEMFADGRYEAVAAIAARLKGRDREMHMIRLARAIGWWRMCGALATRAPDWLGAFFVESDVDVFARAPAP